MIDQRPLDQSLHEARVALPHLLLAAETLPALTEAIENYLRANRLKPDPSLNMALEYAHQVIFGAQRLQAKTYTNRSWRRLFGG